MMTLWGDDGMNGQARPPPQQPHNATSKIRKKKGKVYTMKKIFAILLILALCAVPMLSLASSAAYIESVDFTAGRLSGTVSTPGGGLEAVVTLFLPGNYFFKISAPIEAGCFALNLGTLPCECITIAIKDAMTGAVFDAAMLIL